MSASATQSVHAIRLIAHLLLSMIPPLHPRRLLTRLVYGAHGRGGQPRLVLWVGRRNRRLGGSRDGYRFGLRIRELLSEVVTGVEPGSQSPGLSRRRFPKTELGLARRL